MYRILIRESALLGLEPGRVAARKNFSSHPGVRTHLRELQVTATRVAEEGNGTPYPGMNVNLLNRDNHSGSGR